MTSSRAIDVDFFSLIVTQQHVVVLVLLVDFLLQQCSRTADKKIETDEKEKIRRQSDMSLS